MSTKIKKSRLAELTANAETIFSDGNYVISTSVEPMWRNIPGSTIDVAAKVYIDKNAKAYLKMIGAKGEAYINPGGFYDNVSNSSYSEGDIIEVSVMSREPAPNITVERIEEVAKMFDRPVSDYNGILTCVKNRDEANGGPTKTFVLAEEIN